MQEFLGDGQVHSRGVGIDMPQDRSEVHEPAVRIDALPVPAKQSGYGKGMSKIMKSGWGYPRWNMQLQLG